MDRWIPHGSCYHPSHGLQVTSDTSGLLVTGHGVACGVPELKKNDENQPQEWNSFFLYKETKGVVDECIYIYII